MLIEQGTLAAPHHRPGGKGVGIPLSPGGQRKGVGTPGVVLLAAMQTNFDPREVWDRITWANQRDRRPSDERLTIRSTS